MIGALDGVEHALMDTRFVLGKRSVTSDVVVVSIDNPSIKELKQWPWPRRYHGEVIDRLLAAGAGKIALDIDLSSVSNPEDDRLLVRLAGANLFTRRIQFFLEDIADGDDD